MTSIVAMTENAMPIHTARPSLRRAAMTDIAIADAAARAPATPTTTKWTIGMNMTMTMLVAARSAAGITAERTSNPTTGRRGRIWLMPRLSGARTATLRKNARKPYARPASAEPYSTETGSPGIGRPNSWPR